MLFVCLIDYHDRNTLASVFRAERDTPARVGFQFFVNSVGICFDEYVHDLDVFVR